MMNKNLLINIFTLIFSKIFFLMKNLFLLRFLRILNKQNNNNLQAKLHISIGVEYGSPKMISGDLEIYY